MLSVVNFLAVYQNFLTSVALVHYRGSSPHHLLILYRISPGYLFTIIGNLKSLLSLMRINEELLERKVATRV
jgi:hypothetical protein